MNTPYNTNPTILKQKIKEIAENGGGSGGGGYILTEADKQEIAEQAAQMVEVPEGGTVTDEQIADAVEDYMAEHPVGKSNGKWLGKMINFMGDSITEGYASTEKFADIIAKNFSAICNNYGIGGSTVANGQNPMYSRVLQMDKAADMCVVFGGTNDFANYDRALGEQFVVSNGRRSLNLDTTTFYGGLNQLCTNLYSRFPYSTLVLCTPLNRQNFAG